MPDPNQELLDFIRKRLAANISRAELEKELRIQGYSDQEIAEALSSTKQIKDSAVPAVAPMVPPAMTMASLTASANISDMSETATSGGSLPGFKALLSSAWGILKDRPGTIFGIAAIVAFSQYIPIVFSLVFGSNTSTNNWIYSQGTAFLVFLIFLYIIAYLGSYLWGSVALLYAIKDRQERIGIGEAFKRARSTVAAWVWITFLTSVIVLGGTLLFIIPGMIFGVWFSLAAIVLVAEGLRGMSALNKSKAYVKGRVGEIFGLLFLFGLLYVPFYVVTAIVSSVASQFGTAGTVLQNIAGLPASLIYIPLLFAFQFVLYEHLKALEGKPIVSSKKGRWAIFIVGIFVGIAIIGILVSIVLASLSVAREKGRDATRISDVAAIQTGIESYATANDAYPATLDNLVPQDLPALPLDPSTQAPYQYQLEAGGQSYEICAMLEEATSTLSDLNPDPQAITLNGEYCLTGSASDSAAGTSSAPQGTE